MSMEVGAVTYRFTPLILSVPYAKSGIDVGVGDLDDVEMVAVGEWEELEADVELVGVSSLAVVELLITGCC